MIIIGIGIAALLAIRAYKAMAAADPDGTKTKVDAIFQCAEMVRTLAAFATSFFFVLQGRYRPVVATTPTQIGTQRLAFGAAASDGD